MIIAVDISQPERFGVHGGLTVAVVAGTAWRVVRMNVTVPGTELNTRAFTIAHSVSPAITYV